MNSKEFMTHWKGRPIRSYSYDELIEIIQDLHRSLGEQQEEYLKHLTKTGNFDRFVS